MGFFSKLFSFTQELAIDLGTANTIIIADGEIAVNEPSVVALDQHTEKMIAVGDTAKLMLEKNRQQNPSDSSAQRRSDCRLQRLRANDARSHQESAFRQAPFLTFFANGHRRSLRFNRS